MGLILPGAILALAACSNNSLETLSQDLMYGGPASVTGAAEAPARQPASPQPLTKSPTTEVLPRAQVAPPVIERGAAPTVAQPAPASSGVTVAPGGDVTLNFAGADIRDVAHVVLGDILGLNYTVDPGVQGTVTVQTSRPLPRSAVLPTLEQVFRASGAAIIQENNLIRVVPLQAGAKGAAPQGSGAQGAPSPQSASGFGVQVVPLQFVSAVDLQRILGPFVPAGTTLQADNVRNVLLISGTQQDVQGLLELVRTFDVDWLARTSFALIPLRSVPADTMANEMATIVSGQTGAADSNLRIVPVGRLNAVLVITSQPKYLDWARGWIQRLDEGSEDDAQRTYVYHVQHGRAADLAGVLSKVFGTSGSTTGTASTPFAPPPPSTGGFGGATGTGSSSLPTSGGLTGGLTGGGGGAVSSSNGMLAPLAGAGASGDQSAGAVTPSTTLGESGSGSAGNGGTPVRIVTDDRNNALVIVTTPRLYRQIEETVRRLDVEPMQVVIDATIVEVTLNNQLQYGLQWFFRQQNNSFAFTNVATSVPGQVFPGFSYLFSGTNMQVVLNALSSITNIDVLSAPELMVLNNQTAQLQVGASVPVPVQQAQSVLTPGAPLVNTISYLDTGVILSVTPRANANGEVTLDIEQEVSDAEATTSSSIDAPTVNQRRIKSSVNVQNGQSIALGGLISTNRTFNRSAVPVLGDIPVLGALFRNDSDTKARTELLVLIQPRVIASSADAVAATDDLIHRMQYVEPFVPDKH